MRYVIYSPVCTPCKYKNELLTIRHFITDNKHTLEIKNTQYSKENRHEAKTIGQPLPFIYNADTKQSIPLMGVTLDGLNRI